MAPPKYTAAQKRRYMGRMAEFRLTNQWNNSLEEWWEKHKNVDTVDWRNEVGVLPAIQHIDRPICVSTAICAAVSAQYSIRTGESHIFSRESIASGVFRERAFKALMLRDEAERSDELLKMGGMKPDCDISIEDGLRYVTRFGIPFEERWPLGANRPEGDLQAYKVADYSQIREKDTVTIKHMLRQFPLICDMMVGPAFDSYSTGIYKKELTRRGKIRHAMVLVGWGVTGDGQREYWIVMNSWGDNWGQQGFAYVDINLLSAVFYPIIIPPELAR